MSHHNQKRLIMDKFIYTGKITLSYKKSGKELIKRYYNQGTDNLFRFFAYALAGKDTSDLSPNLIQIGYKETPTGSSEETTEEPFIKLADQPILKLFYDNVTYSGGIKINNVCRLQCNLPLSKISDLTKSEYILQLMSADSTNPTILAETKLTDYPFNDLTMSDQVIIVWDMFVENKPESKQ